MSVVWDATRGHMNVFGISVAGSMLVSMVCASGSRFVLLPENILTSMTCTDAKNHDGICDPCCGPGPCRCLWSVLLMESILMSMACDNFEGNRDVHCLCRHLNAF